MNKSIGLAYDYAYKGVLAALSAATLGVAGWGIFSRNLLNQSVVWADTAATWLFVWTIMLGSAYAVTRGGHMEVGIARDSLPPVAYKWVTIVVFSLVAVGAVFLAYAGWRLVEVSGHTPSPALGITQKWVLWSFPVGGVLMLLAALERLIFALVTPAAKLKATLVNSDSTEGEVL